VRCVEVNEEWWGSKYSKTPFMPLEFADVSSEQELQKQQAQDCTRHKKRSSAYSESGPATRRPSSSSRTSNDEDEPSLNDDDDDDGSFIRNRSVREMLRAGTHALMFCYFNDRVAFDEYLALYAGRCLVIVGPGPAARGRHCDPQPFDLDRERNPRWLLFSSMEMPRNDFVAIYTRKVNC
jgi:hypothetical protein